MRGILSSTFSSQQRQVRHHVGEDDRRAGVRPARGPDGGQAQDGHDRLRQPHARRHEIVIKIPPASKSTPCAIIKTHALKHEVFALQILHFGSTFFDPAPPP